MDSNAILVFGVFGFIFLFMAGGTVWLLIKKKIAYAIVMVFFSFGLIMAIVFYYQSKNHYEVTEFPRENSFPPYQSIGFIQQSSDDAKIRYVIADIQLGDVESYYMNYASQDTNIQQAINLYDSGVRIINIYQFNRIELENYGWQVVYGNTNTVVNCGDMVINSDIGDFQDIEARIRYILADAQLGDVIDYYRQYTDDPAVAEAVNRWDSGVRVINIDQFERRILISAGWKVIYPGTDQVVNARDILLSTDQVNQQNIPDGTDTCSSGEGRIAYIIADIQLGGVDGYYRQFMNDPSVAEALRRWDAGVRLSESQLYERKIGSAGSWIIANVGSDQITNCSGILLTAEQIQQTNYWGICGNPYFPTNEGAYWDLKDDMNGQITHISIESTISDPNGGGSFVRVFNGSRQQFYCDYDGSIRDSDKRLYIPPASAFFTDNEYTDPRDKPGYLTAYHFLGPNSIYTLAGFFDNCYRFYLMYTDMMTGNVTYCFGVGPVNAALDTSSQSLVDYYLP